MVIKNRYHKKLAFDINGKTFGIDAYEIKKVDDTLGRELIKNFWIEEVKEEIKIENKPKEKIEIEISKGRKLR